MVYIWNPATPEVVSASETMLLSSIQLGTAILGACLPTYGPLFKALRKKFRSAMGMSMSETYESKRGPPTSGLVSKQSMNRDLESSPYYRMDGHGDQSIQISRGEEDSVPLRPLPSHSIMVSKSVTVT
jgi:hypothetical protein